MKTLWDRLRADGAGNLAFLATVLAVFATMLFMPPSGLTPGASAALVGLALAYLVLGAVGFSAVEALGRTAGAWAYLAAMTAIAGLIFYLARGTGFSTLLFFPLASQAMYVLAGRQRLAAFALILSGFFVPLALLTNTATALANLPLMLAGIVFVGVFTQIAMRESAARAEATRLAAELAAANQQLRAYAAQVEELATTRERNRAAREIHDSLGHSLTVIHVQLEAAQMLLASEAGQAGALANPHTARALEAVRKAHGLTQSGLADVRRSVASLRAPAAGQRPLPDALAQLVGENQAAGIVTALEVLGQPRALKPEAELTLYRLAQEGLTNVRKHARASHAHLTLDYTTLGRVRLRLQDNGIGAVGEAGTAAEGGFGLLGLRERAQLLGGELRVETQPGHGFALELTLSDDSGGGQAGSEAGA